MRTNQSKIGRNDVCHCGSLKKYKTCCLRIERGDSSVELHRNKNRLGQQIQRQFGNNVTILQDLSDIKMSEIILHVADELLEGASTKKQHQFAITIACTAWNLAVIFDSEQRKAEMERFLDMVADDTSDMDVLRDTISFVIEKINYYYPDVQRVIVDFELIGNKNNLRLNVASTVPKEKLTA